VMYRTLIAVVVVGMGLLPRPVPAGEAALKDQAAKALRRATEFFRTQVSTEGGYLWRYSEDLTRREGEGKATDTMVWVQPPGTPSVGMVYLAAYEATGDSYYLDAARDAAYALVRGQLRSGGWDYRIEFDPKRRPRYAYRVDPPREGARNVSTLDDNNTQSAVRLLMGVDQALDFKDQKIREAVQFALSALLEVQYPNGAWPQRFSGPPDPAKFPVKKAGYPDSWSWTHPGDDYKNFYTFNDNTIADTIATMLEAFEIYGESHGVMRTLLVLYRATGKKKYLEPLPRAMEYLRRSRLSDGRLARFYELKTNKPLYFTRGDYKLTYSDADMPTHYAFKVSYGVESIAQEYERLRAMDPVELKRPKKASRPSLSRGLAARTRSVIDSLDEQGRWVEGGQLRSDDQDDRTRRVIDCRTFISNVRTLSAYLTAVR